MILAALTIDELLRFEGKPCVESEIVRRLRSEDLFTRSQVNEIEDRALGRGLNEATSDAIDFLYGLMDGEVWRDHLDDDTREWIKTDLLMLLDPPDQNPADSRQES